MSPVAPSSHVGRYTRFDEIARGGMATVHIGRMAGAVGFARTVAIKRLHTHLAENPSFVAMFVDEARLAARIHHPNVVDTLDVVAEGGELLLIMDFVLGETVARIRKASLNVQDPLPFAVISSIVIGALEGLHAAHEASDEHGVSLGIVHRDVSPQNIMVGCDGVTRILDFGVAKAAGRMQESQAGELKGKVAYMAPEQLIGRELDRRCDVFAMGIVLWEALTRQRLFLGTDHASTMYAVMNAEIKAPTVIASDAPPGLDAVVLTALERDPARRFATARDMALAIEASCPPAQPREVGSWVMRLGGLALQKKAELVRTVERLGASSAELSSNRRADLEMLVRHTPPSARPFVAPPSAAPHHSSAEPPTGPPHPALPPTNSGVADTPPAAVGWGLAQQSGITSVVTTTPPRQTLNSSGRATQRAGAIAAAVLVGALAVVTLLLFMRASHKESHAQGGAGAPDPTGGLPPMAASLLTPTLEPAPSASPPSSADAPSASASTPPSKLAPPATRFVTPPKGAARAPGLPPAAAPSPSALPPATADCENPFSVDAQGVKHPKPQCFGR